MIFYMCFIFLGIVGANPLTQKVTISMDSEVQEQLDILQNNLSYGGDDTIITATINILTDKILTNIDSFMGKQHFDPMDMPDISKKFSRFLISGEFTLSEGKMTDASTLHRVGDSVVTYNKTSKYLKISVPLGFNDLKIKYNYRVKLMHIGPTGIGEGGVKDLKILVVIGIDFNTFMGSLDKFEITNKGHISMKFYGHPIYDWLFDLMSSLTCTALKPIIMSLVEIIVAGTLKSIISEINNIIQSIIHSGDVMKIATSILANLLS